MATLDDSVKTEVRQDLARKISVPEPKSTIDLSTQAIDDWFDKDSTRSSIAADIDAATPTTISEELRDQIVTSWMKGRWRRN